MGDSVEKYNKVSFLLGRSLITMRNILNKHKVSLATILMIVVLVLPVMVATLKLPAYAAEGEVPAKLGAKIFLKVFGYDKTLQKLEAPEIAITYPTSRADKYTGRAKTFAKQFRGGGYSVEIISSTKLKKKLKKFNVLLVLSDQVDYSLYADMAKANKILTLAPVQKLVKGGTVAIGVMLKDKKPHLLFNLGRLNAEGHQIPSQVLKLGTVFKG